MAATASTCSFSKKKWPNYASGPKSALNSDLFWLRRLFNVCLRVFCAPNPTFLLCYPPRSKWASSEKMIFFSKVVKSNIAIFPSVVQAHTEPYSFAGKTLQFCLITYLPRSKWASSEKMIFLPKFFKVMSQYFPALFKRINSHIGRRIKLIICQIRHELSVTK